MWKKYKFELNFKRLRGQRRRAKDDAKKAEKKKIITPRPTPGVFFASILAVRLGRKQPSVYWERAAARGIRGCEDNAGGQKTTQKKPRRGIEPRTYRLRSGCSTS